MHSTQTDPRVAWFNGWERAVAIIQAAPAPQPLISDPNEWRAGPNDPFLVVVFAGVSDARYLFTIDKRDDGRITAIHRADDLDSEKRNEATAARGEREPPWLAPLLDELPAFARALDLAHYIYTQSAGPTPRTANSERGSPARRKQDPGIQYALRSGLDVRVVGFDPLTLTLTGDELLTADEATKRFDPDLPLSLDLEARKVHPPLPRPGPLPPKDEPPFLSAAMNKPPKFLIS